MYLSSIFLGHSTSKVTNHTSAKTHLSLIGYQLMRTISGRYGAQKELTPVANQRESHQRDNVYKDNKKNVVPGYQVHKVRAGGTGQKVSKGSKKYPTHRNQVCKDSNQNSFKRDLGRDRVCKARQRNRIQENALGVSDKQADSPEQIVSEMNHTQDQDQEVQKTPPGVQPVNNQPYQSPSIPPTVFINLLFKVFLFTCRFTSGGSRSDDGHTITGNSSQVGNPLTESRSQYSNPLTDGRSYVGEPLTGNRFNVGSPLPHNAHHHRPISIFYLFIEFFRTLWQICSATFEFFGFAALNIIFYSAQAALIINFYSVRTYRKIHAKIKYSFIENTEHRGTADYML